MSAVVQVSAGTGPIEVRRFVALLAEHLRERCEERGAIVAEVVVHGDESAPASVELHLAAAGGDIESLAGTHTLVARSDGRGRKSRKRWFAGVQVLPGGDGESPRSGAGGRCGGRSPLHGGEAPHPRLTVSIDRADVTVTAMRAGGPGGQHVNKTSSAVRVFHRPTGITVKVSDERSQRENVRVAMERLARIVREREEAREAGARAGRRLLHYRVERGRPAFVYELDRSGGLQSCEVTCSR